ncbi:MAG: YciI family protein [Tannerellaceae bacterium]|jgi:hypothetical protein|nr:YciI family protein [Tannerellaceae bacterium]
MKDSQEFILIFRFDGSVKFEPTPEQLQESAQQWQTWIGGIASQGKLVATNQLDFTGKTLHADASVSEGPYAEVKEIVGGYLIAKAENIDEALKLAQGCPVLFFGGKVEVRSFMCFN